MALEETCHGQLAREEDLSMHRKYVSPGFGSHKESSALSKPFLTRSVHRLPHGGHEKVDENSLSPPRSRKRADDVSSILTVGQDGRAPVVRYR